MGRRGIGFMEMIEGNIGWRMGLRSGTAGYALRVCVHMCGWIKNYGLSEPGSRDSSGYFRRTHQDDNAGHFLEI